MQSVLCDVLKLDNDQSNDWTETHPMDCCTGARFSKNLRKNPKFSL